jgi:UDP-N-acetylglucosamine acyltransferase
LAEIHPSSLVADGVELDPDCVIGPFCVLEGPIRIGPGTRLISHVCLRGPLELGRGNTLYPQVCIGFPPQSIRPEQGSGVRIGADNVFREGVTVHAAMEPANVTVVGDDNFLMTSSHVGHDSRLGDRCILASGALIAGHVLVADAVNISGNAAVHQFCRIGRLVMVGGTAGTTQDVPPFTTLTQRNAVTGLNRVGLRRAGFPSRAIDVLAEAFSLLYLQDLSPALAVKRIHELADRVGAEPDDADARVAADAAREFAEFVATSDRGVTPHMRRSIRRDLRRYGPDASRPRAARRNSQPEAD